MKHSVHLLCQETCLTVKYKQVYIIYCKEKGKVAQYERKCKQHL